MSKKPVATLSAGLVAVKGQAPAPAADTTPRTPLAPPPTPVKAKAAEGQEPLNFRVSAGFRRAFKTYAATHDLKLNELLRLSFEAYCKIQND
jgi:hypothetical protein